MIGAGRFPPQDHSEADLGIRRDNSPVPFTKDTTYELSLIFARLDQSLTYFLLRRDSRDSTPLQKSTNSTSSLSSSRGHRDFKRSGDFTKLVSDGSSRRSDDQSRRSVDMTRALEREKVNTTFTRISTASASHFIIPLRYQGEGESARQVNR